MKLLQLMLLIVVLAGCENWGAPSGGVAINQMGLSPQDARLVDQYEQTLSEGGKLAVDEIAQLRRIWQVQMASERIGELVVRALDAQGDWDGIAEVYLELPPTTERFRLLAKTLIKACRFEEAESLIRNFLNSDPGNAQARSLLGHTLLLAGKPEEAEAELLASTDGLKGAELGLNLANLAACSICLEKIEQAADYASRSLDVDPRNRSAMKTLVLTCELLGDSHRAKLALQYSQAARNTSKRQDELRIRLENLGIHLDESIKNERWAECARIIELMKTTAPDSMQAELDAKLLQVEQKKSAGSQKDN